MYGDALNVEHEMCDFIGNNWNSNKGLKKLEVMPETR
jgi:hypothetical protein